MNTYEQDIAPDARDFVGGYLKKEDLDGTTMVTIVDVRAEEVPGAARPKLVMAFRELTKPLILNSTNIKVLQAIFQSTNTGLWRGQIALYIDENVVYHGARVGGIRVQPAPAVTTNPNTPQAVGANGAYNGNTAA